MNCTACKNPNNSNSVQCEWCGYNLTHSNENFSSIDMNSINITLSFDGAWMFWDATVKVLVDDMLVGSGSLKNGFHIEFALSKTQPIIILKHAFSTQKINIPKLEFGKKYEFILSYDRYLKGDFNSTPSRIIET